MGGCRRTISVLPWRSNDRNCACIPHMLTRRLGAHGPEISVMRLGAWEAGGDAWGANPADDEVVRAFHAAFDAGITWVDTAEVYGNGVSEPLVGKGLIARRGQPRVAARGGRKP